MVKKNKIPADVNQQETVETTVELVNAGKDALKTTSSALDANHRVDLLSLAHKMFKEDPDAPRKYTVDFLDSMDKIMAAGIVSALAELIATYEIRTKEQNLFYC